MIEVNKEIELNSKHKITYNVMDGYTEYQVITDIDNTEEPKNIKFCRWDDYCFRSWQHTDFDEYMKKKVQSHEFTKENPLYIPLLNLLNGEHELIIDDDETPEDYRNYMYIYLDGETIKIDFYHLSDYIKGFDKFSVFIKNIGHDIRSKIDCADLDTKERLYFFFQDLYYYFTEEYHQMTLEEWLLANGKLDLEESKKFTKKLNLK